MIGLASSWKGTRDINEFQELMKEIDRLRFSIAGTLETIHKVLEFCVHAWFQFAG